MAVPPRLYRIVLAIPYIYSEKNEKVAFFLLHLFRMACFFRLDYFATAELRPAAELYAYFGGKTGTGYQRGYMIGGNKKQERTAGRHCSAHCQAGKLAFSRLFRQRLSASQCGAGADCPGRGLQRLSAEVQGGKPVQSV